MENPAGRIHLRAMARALPGTLAVAALCGLAACSTNKGQRLTADGYRTGATGEALSRAAASNPAAFSRAQAAAGRNATPTRTVRAGAADTRAAGRAATAPRRPTSSPVANPQGQVVQALVTSGTRAGTGVVQPGFPSPDVQRAALPSAPLALGALTPGGVLLASAVADPAATAAARPETADVSSGRWSLGPTQLTVLAVGLALALLGALAAVWSAARRRRAAMAEPRIAAPVAANDLGPVPPRRADGPQLALPLSPAGAAPRIYSASASARLSSR